MNSIIVETERLFLREFTLGDSAFIVELLNSEGWLKYIGDRNVRTTQAAEEYLRTGLLKSYQTNGFGLSMVVLKEQKIPIGMCGLIRRDYLDHPDIGFAFLPQYSGKGYAFEIASKTVEYGFKQHNLAKILAITLPTNRSSIALLEKIGLIFERTITDTASGEELLLYGMNSGL